MIIFRFCDIGSRCRHAQLEKIMDAYHRLAEALRTAATRRFRKNLKFCAAVDWIDTKKEIYNLYKVAMH